MIKDDTGWKNYRAFCISEGYGRHSDRPRDLDEAWWRIESLLACIDDWKRANAVQRGMVTRLKNQMAKKAAGT